MVREFLSDGVIQRINFAGIENTNHPGATGKLIKMALDAGADVIDMKHIQLLQCQQIDLDQLSMWKMLFL